MSATVALTTDFGFNTRIPSQYIHDLATCRFIERLGRLISCSYIITLTGKSYRSLFRPDKPLEKEVVTV